MSGHHIDWRTARALQEQRNETPLSGGLSLNDALRTLALGPAPRGVPIGAAWFYDHAPYTCGYDDGTRIRHRDTGQTGVVVSTRLGGGDLYVLVHWDDTEYPHGHCDVHLPESLEITGPAKPTRTALRQPEQLALDDVAARPR